VLILGVWFMEQSQKKKASSGAPAAASPGPGPDPLPGNPSGNPHTEGSSKEH
jgi:hypothetical protein